MANKTVKDAMNASNPNSIADWFRRLPMGDIIGGLVPVEVSRSGLTSQVTHVHNTPGMIFAVRVGATNFPIVAGTTTPAAGEVAIAYDSDGLATLTFQAAQTAYVTQQMSLPAGLGVTLAEEAPSC